MKRFIIKLLILLLMIVLLDLSFGHLFRYWHGKITRGDVGKANYIAYQANEDILIFGSSRAELHYNPLIISDSLGLSTYNCGMKGMGAIVAWARLSMILKRHSPKIIIFDLLPSIDIYKSDNYVNLGPLKPYYNKEGIQAIFDDIDKKEKYKMLCQTYRFNSVFKDYGKDLFFPSANQYLPDSLYGFQPQQGKIDPKLVNLNDKYQQEEIDSIKLKYLNLFIKTAKTTNFYIVISPFWNGMDSLEIAPVKELCNRNGIHLLDFSNDKKYKFNNELFMDKGHLNAKGADEFTRDLIKRLRPILENSDKHQVVHH